MWGGANWNLSQTTTMRTLLIQNGDTWLRNHDQRMLSKIVWNEAKHDAIVHDSYQCDSFGKTEPWPTRRENNSHYVGKATDWKVPEYLQTVPECPVKCRPKKHLDWIYC